MTDTIVRQIEDIEQKIKSCEDRLDSIDRTLRLDELTIDERENLNQEEKQLKNKVNRHEKQLGTLRKENRKSMLLSVAILVALYLGYVLLWGK